MLCALALVAFVAEAFRPKKNKAEASDETPAPRPEGCCGQHAVCEKLELMKAANADIEYFDDEELDAYKGREAANYNGKEEEEFRDILYTMRPEEVERWTRSLQLRGINLPDGLKDEVFMLLDSARGMASHADLSSQQ